MRQRIFYNTSSNLCGVFSHNADVGFIPHKRGLHRRLVSARECEQLGESEVMSETYQHWTGKIKRVNGPKNQSTIIFNFLTEDLKTKVTKEKYFLDNGKGQTWYANSSAISKAMSNDCKSTDPPAGVKPFH